ncbi:MAG TPA: sigma 54-interacting transcriptional regulator [Gemmatimonadales bacterium]|nr:sigma 54-interacting transcriptional regulator [Gemmatimonadales bacterium]
MIASPLPATTSGWQSAPIVAHSQAMVDLLARASRYAASRLPILLVGETGTGKELLAQHIHRSSGRAGDFVDVNCGAVPREMTESLLFGHRRGAFTGAHADAAGLVMRAAGGTLFLDELTSLPIAGQSALLRVLETGEVRRLGDTGKQCVDFRLVAAVQTDVAARMADGCFRVDLYHRVAGAVLVLPPLRERRDEIVPLAEHFVRRHGVKLAPDAVALLMRYDWPGNVRELRAVIDRAAVLSSRGELDAAVLTDAIGRPPISFADVARIPAGASDAAAAKLLEVCAAEEWRAERIAAALGVSRATLYRRLKTHGIVLRRPLGFAQC